MINYQKQRMIDLLIKELKHTGANGISHQIDMTITPENWMNMKYYLFTGGRYMESHDRKWVNIYSLLTNTNRGLMLGKINHVELNKFIMENEIV